MATFFSVFALHQFSQTPSSYASTPVCSPHTMLNHCSCREYTRKQCNVKVGHQPCPPPCETAYACVCHCALPYGCRCQCFMQESRVLCACEYTYMDACVCMVHVIVTQVCVQRMYLESPVVAAFKLILMYQEDHITQDTTTTQAFLSW